MAQDGNLYWVYFGTGRFLDTNDKADAAQQTYYGIKEPLDCDGEFTWATVEKTEPPTAPPGDQGLFQVDQIKVEVAAAPAYAVLGCEGGGTACPCPRASPPWTAWKAISGGPAAPRRTARGPMDGIGISS